jgi:hypothetical protein
MNITLGEFPNAPTSPSEVKIKTEWNVFSNKNSQWNYTDRYRKCWLCHPKMVIWKPPIQHSFLITSKNSDFTHYFCQWSWTAWGMQTSMNWILPFIGSWFYYSIELKLYLVSDTCIHTCWVSNSYVMYL